MNREFPINGAGAFALWFLAAFAVVMIALAVFFLASGQDEMPLRIVAAAVLLAVGGGFAWLVRAQGRSAIAVGPDGVKVRVPMYGRHIALQDIDVEHVQRVDLNTHEAYRLRWRTNGVGLPGYHLGWHRSRGKGKVLAAVTGPINVAIPLKSGEYTVLASVDSTQGVIDALRCAAGTDG